MSNIIYNTHYICCRVRGVRPLVTDSVTNCRRPTNHVRNLSICTLLKTQQLDILGK